MDISNLFPLIDRLRLQMPLNAITMDVLAAKSGLSRASLYRNYGARREIFSAYLRRHPDVADFDLSTTIPQRILSTARDTFLRFGFANASIERIAEQAGVGSATIYRHFGSKENLIAEMLETLPTPTGPDLEILENDQPFEDQLREFTLSAIHYLQETRQLLKLLLIEGEELQAIADQSQRLQNRTREKLLHYFSRQIPNSAHRTQTVRQLTAAYFGLLIGFAFSDDLIGGESFHEDEAAAWITRSILLHLEAKSI